MKYYAGLDVSMEATSVCIVDEDGNIIKEGSAETEPQSLCEFIKETGLLFKRIGFESGPCSAWLYKGMTEAGMPVVCIDARHANAALKAQNVKTDKNDARGIAQIMRTGWYKASHIKSNESQKMRVLVNTRKTLLGQRLELENQIRGTLKVFGLKVGRVTPAQYELRVRDLLEGDEELSSYIEPLLRVRSHIMQQCCDLDKKVRMLVKHDEVCRRFMSIPGVGPLTALLFKSTIDNPKRFAKSSHVGVHLGLTPRKYASGEIDYNGRITKCGDPMTRTHLYEAAQVMMRRSSKSSDLKTWGTRIAKRGSAKRAYVAVARKLAVIMHRMWVDGTEFHYGEQHFAVAR